MWASLTSGGVKVFREFKDDGVTFYGLAIGVVFLCGAGYSGQRGAFPWPAFEIRWCC